MKRICLLKLAALFAQLLLIAAQAGATDYYMNKSGAGTRSGNSWTNAFASSTVNTVLNTTMVPGDTLYLEGADYGAFYPVITSSGTATARKSLIGVDRGAGLPLLRGTEATRSYTNIWIRGSGYWTLKNLRIEHNAGGIGTTAGNCPGLIFDNIRMYDIASAGFSFIDADNLLVQNCRVDRYNKKGFFWNHSCNGVVVKNCVADCTATGMVNDLAWRQACSSPIGFNFQIKLATTPNNTNILLEDCVTLNNDEDTSATDDYEQGDGFMAEGGNDGITLRRCRSLRNQDGAYDLKGSNQVLEDCVALSSRNGFKLWYSGTLTNCIAVANWAFGLQVASPNAGYTITANRCTFHTAGTNPVGVKVETSGCSAVLNDSIISRSGTEGGYMGGSVTLNNSVTHANASNPANAPRYLNPALPWDGTGTNFNNQTYGLTKGYNSTALVSVGGAINAEADTYVWDGASSTNYGASASLAIKGASGSGYNRVSYLRFPLAAIGSTTASATLKIKVTAIGTEGAGPRTIEVRQLTNDSWIETTTTWSNRPSSAGTLMATIDAGTVGQVYSVDVTSYVNSQISDGKASFVLIQPASVAKYVAFGSREDSANRPSLDFQ